MSIRLTGRWNEANRLLSGFPNRLMNFERNFSKKAGALAVREIKKNIRSRGTMYGHGFEPNTPLTIMKKGSDIPIIDKRKLLNSIGYAIINGGVYVGILKGDAGVKQVARWIHEGFHIPLSNGGIVIVPGRPFMQVVIESDLFREKLEKLFEEEMRRLIRI